MDTNLDDFDIEEDLVLIRKNNEEIVNIRIIYIYIKIQNN